ncbi:MAG: riboflavin biosynthesis protein RibF [Chloroflexota bacterium]
MNRATQARSLTELPPIGLAVVTMGVFDGVHLGHRAALDATRAAAAERRASSVALIFDPHPDEVLGHGIVVPRLAPAAVNLTRMAKLGIQHTVAIRFDEDLRALTAEDFLAALRPAIELRGLVMGRHSSFGREQGGTVDAMTRLGATSDFEVVVVERVEVDGAVVSSTRIREAIAVGDVAAAALLGAPAYLEGQVIEGDRRGRTLGFPTANLRFAYQPAMPALGIYAARVARGGPPHQAALVSIGTRPTFGESGAVVAEVHLLDYDGDLYGTLLGVELVARLRDELRFDDAAALVEQMHRDAAAARIVLETG